jgi:hypothetical protein
VANRRQLVQPPSFTPLPYGLLSVIQTPTDDAHWQNGITYQARCAITMGATTYDECISVTGTGSTLEPPTKSETHELVLRGAMPFTAYADFECSTVGSLAESQQIAEQALAQSDSWQVERAFWTGEAAGQDVVYPHLAATAAVTGIGGSSDVALMQTVPVTGGPFDVAEALGFLEQQLADCYNGIGVIHIPVEALPTFDAWGLVKPQGPRLKTLNGNWVAVGAGYPGTSPAGADPAAGTTWIYATGAVFGYSGDVRVTDQTSSINRSENTVTRIAERTHVLGWDCCHAGALMTLGVATETP